MEVFNITHTSRNKDFSILTSLIKQKCIARGDLAHVTVKEQLSILEDLSSFPLGRHILMTGGANAIWTDYMINYPESGVCKTLSPIEECILFRYPGVLAQRELFKMSQKFAQQFLTDGAVLASIPCGLMRDLLSLDFTGIKDALLLGIDIDAEALEGARKLSKNSHCKTQFIQGNAWDFQYDRKIDFITSVGLAEYAKDRQSVINLYKNFYKNLKKGGVLFTGILTYPPGKEKRSDWLLDKMHPEDIRMEKILTENVIDLNFQNYRTLDEIKEDFIAAGFSTVEIYLDSCQVFPGVIAKKS